MDKVEVFIASSHKDKMLADKIMFHLKPLERQGVISITTDSKFQPGTDWESQIHKQLNSADISLLLISSDFLYSSRFEKIEIELQHALLRQKSEYNRIIPIILRPVPWRGTLLDTLQALPTGGKPVTTWANREAAFFDITQGVRKAVEELIGSQTKTQVRDFAGRINLITEEEYLEKKARLETLENDLRRSNSLLRDYQEMRSISYNPIEKQNAQRSTEKLLNKMNHLLSEYIELANQLGITVPEDIIQISAQIEETSEDIRSTGNIE